jgi:diaminopropionate ammonia-lyase
MTPATAVSPSEICDLWDDYSPTPLIDAPALARQANVARILIKVEAKRPLGNFKALGGMVAGLRAIARALGAATVEDLTAHPGRYGAPPRLICASDGNHGLSVAAAAQRAGSPVSIFLPRGVSPVRAERIRALGGEIVWIDGTYDDAVAEAALAAARGHGLLVPDTSEDPDDRVVKDVMAGYELMTRELTMQFGDAVSDLPTHQFIQAGVGGLAAAIAQGLQDLPGAAARLLVVEPRAAACVARGLVVGRPERIAGGLETSAEMLSCGLASAPALAVLLRHEARSVLVEEEDLRVAVAMLAAAGLDTTASGAAGLAGLMVVAADEALRARHRLTPESRVLTIMTEGI